jgi:GntR family transcriptional regulator
MTEIEPSLRRLLRLPADRTSHLPIYVQIADSIRSLIKAGSFQPGTLLPPERLLCEVFEVSRMTLRQAYDLLEREDLIQGQRGRGTLVTPPRMRKEQQEMRSFTEEIRARGGTPNSKLLRFEAVDPVSQAREILRLPAGQQVYRIERIRFSDSTPLAIEQVDIPCYLCPDLEKFDLTRQSLYQILEREYGLQLVHCVETISAIQPSRSHRQLLQLPRDAAILRIERKTFCANDTPAELAVTTYRGDMYQALVHSTRLKTPKS